MTRRLLNCPSRWQSTADPGRFEIRNLKLGPILKDKAVVLDGVKPGEMVATSGNFLIDSQMQLAGKPSLIDPTRYVQPKVRNRPMKFDSIDIARIEGLGGEELGSLYQAYFAIQNQLASDKKPTGEAAGIRLFPPVRQNR